MTYGSPMTKLSPALIDGTRPKEPTRAAAPSLRSVMPTPGGSRDDSRDDVSVKVGSDSHVEDPERQRMDHFHVTELSRTRYEW
jgi:hypothetical protein